ncbi:GrpB domain, predicted nucleotidyltransferase, UPF0157 family [Evansella caseinilytica]|uniref:GrpB domain, predicted nucleotidyltransferase, UPF0157 family n=1 Tax=Evansella caseinilytica TaxID=1503961 RepID=A0A1H3ICY6_9BACI|nr:GrpB family protein [Evansella caseinilytica]SDY25487.1 GrpB domain, predicted nucleotidyltransferase, UPF0157 family [Evansella caseinilytica]
MNIIVTEYDENWVQLFEKEAELLKAIFNKEIITIHHIGSTAVPNLKAKPVIDLMPVVKNIEKVDDYNEQMMKHGYEPMGEVDIKGRRYFRKGGDDRTHNVHMFQVDNHAQIDRHLAVRDYLRAHPEAVHEYGELKAALAVRFPKDIYGYMDGKNEFVKDLERKAVEWRRRNE